MRTAWVLVAGLTLALDGRASAGGGTTRWVNILEQVASPLCYAFVATSDNGIILGPGICVDTWRRFDLEGNLQWERERFAWVLAMVPSTEEIFGVGNLNPDPWHRGEYLYRFDPDGLNPVELDSDDGDCCRIVRVETDRNGNHVNHHNTPGGTYFVYQGIDGTTWEFGPFYQTLSAALDDFGNVLVPGNLPDPINIQGFELQRGFTVFKVAGTGQILWAHQIPNVLATGIGLRPIGVSASGTPVLMARFNTPFDWAGEHFEPDEQGTDFLLVAEGEDGEERLARPLDGASFFALAVDPVGEVAILAIPADCNRNGRAIYKYNLAGDFLWRRDFIPQNCSEGDFVGGHDLNIGIANRNVVFGAFFQGTVDFGTGPQTAERPTTFLLSLEP